MNKTIMRGVRTDAARLEKWNAIAKQMGVSKNEAFNLLLDGAEVLSRPQAKVTLSAGSIRPDQDNGTVN